MKTIFVDTWAWYALVDKADQDHTLAQLANEDLLNGGHIFVTTNFVLDEAVTLIRYNVGHKTAVEFWHKLQQLMQNGLVDLVRVDETHEKIAWQIFEQYADQTFSYTDCTSFAVMRTLQLTRVFTADHHFTTMGFTVVP